VPPLGQLGEGFPREVDMLTGPSGRWVPQSSADYDSCGNPVHVYHDGVQRVLGYDANCLHPTSETLDPGNGAASLSWKLTWDDAHVRPSSLREPNGNTLNVGYDPLDRQVTIAVNGFSPHEHVTYDWRPPLPRTTSWVFDGTSTDLAAEGPTWPSGSHWRSTTVVANGAGESLYTTTPLGGGFIVGGWKERDERGQIVRTAEAFLSTTAAPTAPGTSRIQTMDYDAQGRLRARTLANGATKTIAYRALQQTTTTTDLGPVTSELDGLLRVVHTERNPGAGSVLETVDAGYDASGRITALSLQDGLAIHAFAYDAIGRMVHANDPDIGDRDLVYDDRNFLIQYTNGAGQSLYYEYDGAGRVLRRGETPTPAAATDYTYTYDSDSAALAAGCQAAARMAAATEPDGSVQLCYDFLGRQVGIGRTVAVPDAPAGTGSRSQTLSLSGLLLAETFDDGFNPTYAYDPAGRLTSISSQGAALWTADDVDGAGRVTSEHYGNGAIGRYQYDLLGLPSRITVDRPAGLGTLYDVMVTRNSYGAPTIVTDTDNQGLDQNATFSYDGAARLKQSTLGTGGQRYTFTFSYDALQNMIARGVAGPADLGVLAGSYRYGERGYGPRQLTSVVPGGAP
jgi:YD repeat-containing protein